MLNEGIINNDTSALMRGEMIKAIRRLGPTDPESWNREVFHAVTGEPLDEVDWSVEDNQAGYYTWIRSFDRLIQELVDDGYVRLEGEDRKTLVPTEVDPHPEFSHQVYPPR